MDVEKGLVQLSDSLLAALFFSLLLAFQDQFSLLMCIYTLLYNEIRLLRCISSDYPMRKGGLG